MPFYKRQDIIFNTDLTIEEIEILKKTDDILHKLQHELGQQLTMKNLKTGEIIDTEEFLRVRGILDGLTECDEWAISLNKRIIL